MSETRSLQRDSTSSGMSALIGTVSVSSSATPVLFLAFNVSDSRIGEIFMVEDSPFALGITEILLKIFLWRYWSPKTPLKVSITKWTSAQGAERGHCCSPWRMSLKKGLKLWCEDASARLFSHFLASLRLPRSIQKEKKRS